MDYSTHLSKTSRDPIDDSTLYGRLMDKLQYLTNIQPNIVFSVRKLSYYLEAPTTEHHKATLRILCYLKKNPTTGLFFCLDNDFILISFVDANWIPALTQGGHQSPVSTASRCSVSTALSNRTVYRPTQSTAQHRPLVLTLRSRFAFFEMSTLQDERVSNEGLPSCTPPSQNSLMECDMVELLVCVLSEVAKNLSNQQENLSGDVVVHGQKSNKLLYIQHYNISC
nr:uncharacterized protein LOC112803250 [Arachis hypogaea]